MKAIMKNHKVLTAIAVIVLLFGIYNAVWYGMVYAEYGKWTTGLNKHSPKFGIVYYDNWGNSFDDVALVEVNFPYYLGLGVQGSLKVQIDDNDNATDRKSYSISVFPSANAPRIYSFAADIEATGTYVEIGLDSDMNLVDPDPAELKLLEEYSDIIKLLYDRFEAQWGKIG